MSRFAGKFFGAATGFLFGGPIGAMVGGILGHMVDSAEPAGRAGAAARGRPIATSDRDGLVFVSHLVAILTLVARADGEVQPEEVRAIRRFFATRLGYDHRDLEFVRQLMQETIRVQPDLARVCAELRRMSRPEDLLVLLRMVYLVAFADRRLDPKEAELIGRVVHHLQIDPHDHHTIRAEFLGDDEQAYRHLGLAADASDSAIKKAYKEMAIKYHPDKVAHLGEEFRQLANDKFQQINSSYQEIRKARGF